MRIAFKGAVFDADGTLIDSMHMWRSLGLEYLKKFGIHENASLNDRLFALSFEQGCEYLSRHYDLNQTSEKIRSGILNMIRDFYVHDVMLKDGVHEFLDVLKSKHIPMVIATSGDRDLLTSALKRLNVYEYFDEIFTCSELNTNKHDPKIFMACSEFMKLEPESIAVFEDSLHAIRTAKSTGFFVYAVEDDSSRRERTEIKAECDYYIEDFMKEEIITQ